MPRTKKADVASVSGPRLVARSSRSKPVAPKPAAASRAAIAPTLVVTHDQIATRAYEFFLLSGGSHGSDVDHWLRAEQELQTVQMPLAPSPVRKRAVLKG